MVQDDAFVEAVKSNYRKAPLSDRQKALCKFAEKLTTKPSQMKREDVDHLRQAGLTDRDVVDLVQVIAFFNYINRIADGLGVDPEPWMR